MSGHSNTNHAHPTTTADGSTDAHPVNTHAQSQLLPFRPANPPTHFPAGNSFGPYVFNRFTTNHPHPEFLDSLSNPILVKLDIANYLRSNHNYTHNSPSNNTTVDTFRYYLCASLARHHSYKKAYLRNPFTNPMRSYHKKHQNFTIHFTTALKSILNDNQSPTPKQQTDLLDLERTLTHETFALWPHLCTYISELILPV